MPSPSLTLLPAVDVAGGRAAQVVDGGPDDPGDVARGWVDQGARWIHLVDLDLAFGRGQNGELLAGLVRDLPVPVQLSGGVGDHASLERAAGTGAARVVLASSALADPTLVEHAHRLLGERLVVALDLRDGRVVARGTGLDLGPLAQVLARNPVLTGEVAHVLVADAGRDGRRTGADLALFADVATRVSGQVTASGGVASLEDLASLRGLTDRGVTHTVLGAALYHGSFTLPQALEVTR
ncbi:HisA/HisF-related TIM barrel protein [Ornithinimicrobium sp. LYQ92]|uniref:HisA/HisF-related TIM barrel protein n=1 Tax=Serinicoccus sp. LYQ92 TaxID=3378798 RepID=UPI003854DE51